MQGPPSWSADGRRILVALVGSNLREVRAVTVDDSGPVVRSPVPPARPGGSVSAAFFTGAGSGAALVTLESCRASTSGGWQLARRTLVAASPGPASDVTPIAQPHDLRVNRSGAVVVTTRDGAILVGILPNLRTLSGRYMAADR